MGRLVSPKQVSGKGYAGSGNGDDYAARVAKYIPAEIIGAYVAVQNLLPAVGCRVPAVWWYAVYAIFLALTPAYLYKQRTSGEPYKLHLAISTVAFVIWSYALTDCSKFGIIPSDWYSAPAAGVALVLFSLIVGVFQPEP